MTKKSPYVRREININSRLSKEEKSIYTYVNEYVKEEYVNYFQKLFDSP